MITDNKNSSLRYFTLCCCLHFLVTWHGIDVIAQSHHNQAKLHYKSNIVNTLKPQNSTPLAALEPLPLGKPITKKLAAGQWDRYQVNLAAGQYLEVAVTQQQIDLVVRLLDSTGKVILETDGFTGDRGIDRLSWVSEAAADYQIAVGSLDAKAAGSYQLEVTALQQATQSDRQLATACKLNVVAIDLLNANKLVEAAAKLEQVVTLEAQIRGQDHPALISPLTGLINLYGGQRNFARLETILQQLTSIAEKNFGPQSRELAENLVTLGSVHYQRNQFDKAIASGQQALAIQEKLEGRESHSVARTLSFLGRSYQAKRDYAKAETIYLQCLPIWEKLTGKESSEVGMVLNSLGLTYAEQRNYSQSESVLQRSLGIFETISGPNSISVAQVLFNLAGTYHRGLKYQQAEGYYQRSLAIQENQTNPDYAIITTTLNNFGAFYQDIGDFEQAEKLLQRSLAIREKTLKPDHPLIAISLNNLGLLYTDKGDYEQAERIHQRGLAIREKVLGNDHPETAISLNNLSIVYSKKGDYTRAQQLSARSLASREKVFGANHPIVAVSLNTLAGIYYQQGKQTEAIPLFQRSIAIEEKVLGPDHLTLAPNINNLALAYAQQGDLVQATTLLERSLAIREKALGSEHPLVAVALSNLAFIYQDRQAYAQAEDYFQRSLKIYERVFGDTHPDIATIYDNLAGLYELQQRMTEAIAARVKCNEVRERELLRNLAPGSENQKLKYLAVSGSELDATLTLHLQAAPQDPTIGAAALTIALRRKGRALDAMTNALSNLRRLASEEDRQLLDRLATVRSEITVQLNKIGEQGTKLTAQIQQLQQQAEELEAQISNRSAELRHQLQLQHTPINLDKVQQAIPRNTALVEFVIYRPVTRANLPKDTKYSAPHYAAYLLQSQGHPLAVDLGPVAEIDQAASALRKALIKQPGKALSNLAKNVKPCARQLDKLIMQPIRQLLNQNDLAGQNRLTRLLISPDGNLNLVPFDALVDEHQRFLVERYEISYLTSGRDLLRQQSMENTSENNESHESNENNDPKTTKITKNTLTNQTTNTLAVVILANPDYGNGQGPVLLGLQANPLKQLRGAASEGTQLQRQLPQARLLQGREASETIMRTLQRPTILHIATHGYFLQYPSGNQADNDKDNANEKDRTNEVELVDNKSVSDKLFGKQAINNLADIDKLALNVNAQRALVLESQDPIAIDPALLRQTNPLLRSYLFFAGANSGQLGNAPQTTTSQTTAPQTTILQSAVTQNNVASNDNDGVMTALDIAGLNLLGTKLVVLSACDTGLGEVRNGDGVYGLRRALVLAGAESQMISLWPVADRATRELMVNYYQTLRLGKGRSAGLRAVRLKMLHDPRRRHPYYWASFIQSGEWGKLTDK